MHVTLTDKLLKNVVWMMDNSNKRKKQKQKRPFPVLISATNIMNTESKSKIN